MPDVKSVIVLPMYSTLVGSKDSRASTSAIERIGVLNTGPTPALSSTFTFMATMGLIISL